MLKSLDVLIGLTVIMLALSMSVTVLTQLVTTTLNTRGRHLKRGLVDLLNQIDPALARKLGDSGQSIANRIADAVLMHPLISSSGKSLGSVIHREELTRLLLDFAGEGTSLDQDAKAALQQALARNGIDDSAATLRRIREVSLKMEAANPQLAANMRQTLAILREASSEFTAKINNMFDGTIDRVAQRFTASTHLVTLVAALLVAGGIQVDTISLVNRLSADDVLRQAFVTHAASLPGRGMGGGAATGVSGSTPETMDVEYMAFLADNGLITVARSPQDWLKRWGELNVLGVLVTCLLISLGAPFWYNALGSLLQLRSVLAAKDDQQRASRESRDAAPGAASPPPAS